MMACSLKRKGSNLRSHSPDIGISCHLLTKHVKKSLNYLNCARETSTTMASPELMCHLPF